MSAQDLSDAALVSRLEELRDVYRRAVPPVPLSYAALRSERTAGLAASSDMTLEDLEAEDNYRDGAPAAITNLRLHSKTTSDIIVEWDTPTLRGAAIQVSSDGGATYTDASGTQHEFTGLDAGVEYHIRVRTTRRGKVSTVASLAITTAGGTDAPDPPSNLRVTFNNFGVITVGWDAEVGLDYEYSTDDITYTNTSIRNSHAFVGLTSGTAYTFYIRAVDGTIPGAPASITETAA